MVTYSNPSKNHLSEAIFVIMKAMRKTFKYEKPGDIPNDLLTRFFYLDKVIVDQIEHRESQDIIHCSVHIPYKTPFTEIIVEDNDWIQDWGKLKLKESPLITGCVYFNGDDRSSVYLTTNLTNKDVYYERYISSEKWRIFRNKIFKERGFQCELCDNKKNLQLHHITYENFGQEKDLDVMILCEDCHNLAHSK